ncbi:hypothetical protein GVN21_07585 [Caulobacter sp. SLTY]|uniref:hypothetical protein n=1 Tax=Caulobacter sp. SLTY TaxID=2683262 RepID=UPI001412DA3B|nr:hypothetical protein [Caulobacter sp. SLTY]NBB15216.1 hypothetical protein [Caulobacter sp. SLTY]
MTASLKLGLKAALLSAAALVLTTLGAAPAHAQGSAAWFCYVSAESSEPKGVVISQVFEWYGEGRPPQNVMGSQFEKISRPEMPSARWPLSNCSKERVQIENSRTHVISTYARLGGAVRQVFYAYEAD